MEDGGGQDEEDDLEAEKLTSPAVRSNALLVLGDLCVRYTSLVDR